MKITVRCDRCSKEIEGTKTEHMTGGYYDLSGKYWKDLAEAKDGEKILFDACMFACPKYIKIYGNHLIQPL